MFIYTIQYMITWISKQTNFREVLQINRFAIEPFKHEEIEEGYATVQ